MVGLDANYGPIQCLQLIKIKPISLMCKGQPSIILSLIIELGESWRWGYRIEISERKFRRRGEGGVGERWEKGRGSFEDEGGGCQTLDKDERKCKGVSKMGRGQIHKTRAITTELNI